MRAGTRTVRLRLIETLLIDDETLHQGPPDCNLKLTVLIVGDGIHTDGLLGVASVLRWPEEHGGCIHGGDITEQVGSRDRIPPDVHRAIDDLLERNGSSTAQHINNACARRIEGRDR